MLTSWVQRESRKLCTEREAGRIGEGEVGRGEVGRKMTVLCFITLRVLTS